MKPQDEKSRAARAWVKLIEQWPPLDTVGKRYRLEGDTFIEDPDGYYEGTLILPAKPCPSVNT